MVEQLCNFPMPVSQEQQYRRFLHKRWQVSYDRIPFSCHLLNKEFEIIE